MYSTVLYSSSGKVLYAFLVRKWIAAAGLLCVRRPYNNPPPLNAQLYWYCWLPDFVYAKSHRLESAVNKSNGIQILKVEKSFINKSYKTRTLLMKLLRPFQSPTKLISELVSIDRRYLEDDGMVSG